MQVDIITSKSFDKNTDTLEQLLKLDKQMPFGWSWESWLNFCASSNFICSIGKVDNALVGMCLFSLNECEQLAHLLKVVVDKSYRKRGFGTMLYRVIEENLIKSDYKKLYLEVATDNISAQGLYQKLGYEHLVLKKKFYSDGSDAYAMQKEIN